MNRRLARLASRASPAGRLRPLCRSYPGLSRPGLSLKRDTWIAATYEMMTISAHTGGRHTEAPARRCELAHNVIL